MADWPRRSEDAGRLGIGLSARVEVVLLLVPHFFKWSTDALNGKSDLAGKVPDLLVGAIALVIAYNLTRLIQLGLNQLRDALFASVGQYAVRQLAYKTFVHMHELSLRHLERKTGGLSRIIERGTKGIETIVRFTILNSVPTLIEFVLTAIIFWWGYGFSYLAVTAFTVWAYLAQSSAPATGASPSARQ